MSANVLVDGWIITSGEEIETSVMRCFTVGKPKSRELTAPDITFTCLITIISAAKWHFSNRCLFSFLSEKQSGSYLFENNSLNSCVLTKSFDCDSENVSPIHPTWPNFVFQKHWSFTTRTQYTGKHLQAQLHLLWIITGKRSGSQLHTVLGENPSAHSLTKNL